MNIFFRRGGPEGDLGERKSSVKVAQRRREALTELFRSPTSAERVVSSKELRMKTEDKTGEN